MKYRNVSSVPVSVSDGRSVEAGDFIELNTAQAADSHNASLIGGSLLLVSEKPEENTLRSGGQTKTKGE